MTTSIKAKTYALIYRLLESAAGSSHRRPSILVDCIAPFHYHHVKPLVDRLIQEDRVTVAVVASEGFPRNAKTERLVAPARMISRRIAWFQPFDLTVSLDLSFTPLPQRGVEVYLPHGAGMKSNYTHGNALDRFDVVCVTGRRREESQAPHLRPGTAVERIGFLVTETPPPSAAERDTIMRMLKVDPARPTILYTPSWSSNPRLILFGEEILRALSGQQYWNVIVRPHPYLLDPAKCNGRDWRAFMSQIGGSTLTLADDFYTPVQTYMHLSDALLGDYSSTIFEYLFLDRPIVLHRHREVLDHYNGTDAFDEISLACHWFDDITRAIDTIHVALKEGESLSAQRQEIVDARYFNRGRAVDAAVAAIYRHVGATRDS